MNPDITLPSRTHIKQMLPYFIAAAIIINTPIGVSFILSFVSILANSIVDLFGYRIYVVPHVGKYPIRSPEETVRIIANLTLLLLFAKVALKDILLRRNDVKN